MQFLQAGNLGLVMFIASLTLGKEGTGDNLDCAFVKNRFAEHSHQMELFALAEFPRGLHNVVRNIARLLFIGRA